MTESVLVAVVEHGSLDDMIYVSLQLVFPHHVPIQFGHLVHCGLI
jgi:hypothetical protein